MTGKDRGTRAAPAALLPTGVVLGLLVLTWAASTGPVAMFHASGRTLTFRAPRSTAGVDTSVGPTLREVTKDVQPQFHLAWVGDLVAWALLFGLCLAAFLGLRRLWLHRWQPPEKPEPVAFEVLPDGLLEVLGGDAAARLAAVDRGSPRNGIVACWLRLQEVLTEAGVPPRPSETSAEFVVRTLRSLDLDPRPIGSLAALYREARFSEHELGEDARTAARSALQALHDDLRARGAVS